MNLKQNLFDLANQNTTHIEAFYLTCISKDTGTNQEKFANFVKQDGKISINFRPQNFMEFLTTGKHLNVYELAKIKAKQSGLTTEQELKTHLKSYYQKRKGFNDTFTDEESFRYGTINTGGIGSFNYGEYCVILKSDFPEMGQNIAYVKSDSLKDYVNLAGKVNVVRLEKDLAPDSHKCRLATIKHENDIPTHPEKNWPAMLCSDKTYMEAVFVQTPVFASLDRVRISVQNVDEFESLAFKSLTTGLADNEKLRSDRYIEILTLLRNQNVLLEIV